MKKTAFLIFVFWGVYTFAQENKSFKPSITIGYAQNFAYHGDVFMISAEQNLAFNTCGSLFVSADMFYINKYLSGGLYIGGQNASLVYIDNWASSYFVGRTGISAHLHLFPQSDMWDVSLNASLGVFWSPHIVPQSEYGLGLSTTFYPLKHLGLLIGCDWGDTKVSRWDCQFLQKGGISLKAGVSIKF